MNKAPAVVLCPHHNKPLVVKIEPGREVGICECDPNDRVWYGKPVYTKLVDVIDAEPTENQKEKEK